MLAINILKWPGFNQALILSIVVLVALIAGAVLYGKRRPVGKPLSWGEAHARRDLRLLRHVHGLRRGPEPVARCTRRHGLGWRTDKKVYGPGDILQAQSPRRQLPVRRSTTCRSATPSPRRSTSSSWACRSTSSSWWQTSGQGQAERRARRRPTYGRPLVRKGVSRWPALTPTRPCPSGAASTSCVEVDADDLDEAGPAEAVDPDTNPTESERHHVGGLRRHLPVEAHPHGRARREIDEVKPTWSSSCQDLSHPRSGVLHHIDDDAAALVCASVRRYRCPTGDDILGKVRLALLVPTC